MDFERVIFRVHAAALGPLERNEERCRVKPREACRACSECLLVVAVGLLLVTTALHATLGTDRCLAPRLKERLGRYDNGSYVDWRLPRDAVVKIRLVNELPDDDDLFVGETGVAPQRHDDDDGIPGRRRQRRHLRRRHAGPRGHPHRRRQSRRRGPPGQRGRQRLPLQQGRPRHPRPDPPALRQEGDGDGQGPAVVRGSEGEASAGSLRGKLRAADSEEYVAGRRPRQPPRAFWKVDEPDRRG